MRRSLLWMALALGCGPKPLAPVPAPAPPRPPADATAPSGHAHRPERDPRGGYRWDEDHRDDGDAHVHQPPPRDLPPHDPPPPDDPPPAEPKCEPREFIVTHCITGGAAFRGPDGTIRARRSCSTRCSATAPSSGPSTRCQQVDARHFTCNSFAP